MSHRYDWTTADPLLGTIPDVEIARMVGCPAAAVMSRRNRKGIRSALPSGRPADIDWAPADPFWGRRTDREIGEVVGADPGAVKAHRHRHGIGAYRARESTMIIHLRLTDEDEDVVQAAADAAGVTPQAWVRSVAVAQARRVAAGLPVDTRLDIEPTPEPPPPLRERIVRALVTMGPAGISARKLAIVVGEPVRDRVAAVLHELADGGAVRRIGLRGRHCAWAWASAS